MTAVGEISVKFCYRLWIALTLESYQNSEVPKDDPVHAAIAERGRRTEALLQSIKRPVSEISEELAGWLVYEHRRGNEKRKQLLLKELLSRRREDGMRGITVKSDCGHYLVTGSVLFALTTIGLDTSDPVVRKNSADSSGRSAGRRPLGRRRSYLRRRHRHFG